MMRGRSALLSAMTWGAFAAAALCGPIGSISEAPHHYWERPLQDRFTLLKSQLESGAVPLDRSSEKAFLVSLLKALEVPVSSQMLVFSTTSLQLRLISPSNPRALYFNDDVYVGYIPGGKLEIVSLDPALGGIFYIMDIARAEQPLRIERSTRCMNCHSAEDTNHVPGLVIRSVVPGSRGGTLMSFRVEQTGHGIPLAERFGGWYVTGKHGITEHWGNSLGRLVSNEWTKVPIEVGKLFDFDRYPAPTSDVLPQLLHEHQAGFVNRVVEAAYRARAILEATPPRAADVAELEEQARAVTRYLLFAEEVPLPSGGVAGETDFKSEFLRSRRIAAGGASLKDFDLQTRLFRHRCSYMIYSPIFEGLPRAFKQRVYSRLGQALSIERPDAEYAYLPAQEKVAIRSILKSTLPDLPSSW